MPHKFKIGQTVYYHPKDRMLSTARGTYTVTGLMPASSSTKATASADPGGRQLEPQSYRALSMGGLRVAPQRRTLSCARCASRSPTSHLPSRRDMTGRLQSGT